MPGVLAFSWLRGGMPLSAEGVSGKGAITGVLVHGPSVEMQFRGHTGYELLGRKTRDLERLRERLGAERSK